jgi:methyl-accepting chemotaxis protein
VVREVVGNAGRSSLDIEERSTHDSAVIEEAGFLDVLVEGEEALPRLNATTERIAKVMEHVGELAAKAAKMTERSDAAGKGFAGRLTAARSLARALGEPGQEVLDLGKDYASQLIVVDAGFRTLIEMSDLQAATGITEDERKGICEFFEAVREMAREAETAVGQVEEFSTTLATAASSSRDLRAPARLIRDGLRYFSDGLTVIQEWVRLIDESDVDCAPREAIGS